MLSSSWRKGNSPLPIIILLLLLIIFSLRQFSQQATIFSIPGTPQQPAIPGTTVGASIPPKIWQISSVPADHPTTESGQEPYVLDPESLGDSRSWPAQNPGYQYNLLGAAAADEFVRAHFRHSYPALVGMYEALRNPGMKTDLLRYLVLFAEGGVYSDLDTWAFQPVDRWVPEGLLQQRGGQVRAIVGLEFDQLDGDTWPGFDGEPSYMTHVVQFCQWTIAAAPGHPLLANMLRRVVANTERLAAAHDLPVAELHLANVKGYEVVTATGPGAWTEAVFEELQRADPTIESLAELSNLTAPRLVEDILVLTIDGFGMGQPHSHATPDPSDPAVLVKHNFRHTSAR